MSDIDPDLLGAFVPEYRQGAARLAEAAEPLAAGRLLANLRAMAAAVGAPALRAPLEAAEAAIDPFDPAALRDAAAAMAASLDTLTVPATFAPVRTLIVDDSPMMRRLLGDILAADPSFTVVGEAGDGAEALALCAGLAPNLILLDIEMPGMDGVAMLRRWTLEGAGAVVVVSSATPPGSALAREVRRLGAAAVVAKPSGALSGDLAERRGSAVAAAARRAAGLAAGS